MKGSSVAGYSLYSLDSTKFQRLIDEPTAKELEVLARLLADGFKQLRSHCEAGEPILRVNTDIESRFHFIANRLPLLDWYGDLSEAGKSLWEGLIFDACYDCDEIDVGFYHNCGEGIYWDVIEIAFKALGVPDDAVCDIALSAFGNWPFRYHPKPKDRFDSSHSMHTLDEVKRMIVELKSIESVMTELEDEETVSDYEDLLLPTLEAIADERRMLFVYVDT